MKQIVNNLKQQSNPPNHIMNYLCNTFLDLCKQTNRVIEQSA